MRSKQNEEQIDDFQQELEEKWVFSDPRSSSNGPLSSTQYTGFSEFRKTRKLKPRGYYSRPIDKLPRHVQDNLNTIQFGVPSMKSDNIQRVMMGTFQNEFVTK
jgi:hypothetical protein